MEVEFGKHFRDATNLLLIMDYDSGYVEAGESSSCTSSTNESVPSTKMSVPQVSQNFLFNEDALLEKPEISLNWSANLPYDIDVKEYEESRHLFFSPGYINASVQSNNSTLVYSGLDSDPSLDGSTELPIEKPILVKNKADIYEDEIIDYDDVLIISASETDMSLVESEESDTLQSQNQCYNNPITGNIGESAIKSSNSCTNFESANGDLCPENTEDEESSMEDDNLSLMEKDAPSTGTKDVTFNSPKQAIPELCNSFSVKSTDIWNVNNTPKSLTPSKSNPLDTVTNTFEVPKEKRRLTLVFCKSEKENGYSVKRKYPSLTPTKKTPEKINSTVSPSVTPEQAYPSMMTPEKMTPRLADPYDSVKKSGHAFRQILPAMTPEKACSSVVFDKSGETEHSNMTPEEACSSATPEKACASVTPEKACSSVTLDKNALKQVYPCMTPEKPCHSLTPAKKTLEQTYPCMTPEKKTPTFLCPKEKVTEQNLTSKTPGSLRDLFNANIVDKSKTPKTNTPKLVVPCVSPRENVKKNVFKQKLFDMTPEKMIPKQACLSMIPEKAILNQLDPSVNTKQNLKENVNFKRKLSSIITPEKTIQKLAVNNSFKKYNASVKQTQTPEKKPPKPANPYFSPDLFDDDDMVDESTSSYFEFQTNLSLTLTAKSQTEEKYATKLDQKLLKRTQKGMSGVLPPPSVTIVHLSAQDILSKWEENQSYCLWTKSENLEKQDKSLNSSTESNSYSKSLLMSVDVGEAKHAKWPEIYDMRCHGLHYNCGRVSEEIVDLCDKYQKRFVGAETQSTCTIFEKQNLSSPSKRKTTKPRFGGKSPGRRLSHLARRRITFSHANLQASSSSLAGSRARQILVDAKKIDLVNRRKSPRKSPRKTPRKTPSKSPKLKTRTPSSSAKKKLAVRFRKLTGELKSVPSTSEMSSTQRALFNSPNKGASQSGKSVNRSTKRALFQSPGSNSSSSIFSNKSQDLCGSQEKGQFRRALFASPKKHSPFKMKKSPFKQFGMERKRKRSESDDAAGAKFARSMSMDHRPSTSTADMNNSLSRTQSELNISLNRSQTQTELSDQHKRKLLWAVSGALKSQNVTSTHPQWKVFASVLARVTRRFYINQIQAKTGRVECATSERMHRIARHHVISVIKGKTADEIFNDYMAKNRALRVQKPQGYVAPEEFNQPRTTAPSGGKENAFQDRSNTMESWEKRKFEQVSKPSDNKLDRIRKVINFGDDR